MDNNNFDFLLLRASKEMGSLLEVAGVLKVEPKVVYMWMAKVDCPSAVRRVELARRLNEALGRA